MINWGVIGLGNMSYRFINAIKEVKNTKLVSIASLSKKKSIGLIKELGIKESLYFNNYDDNVEIFINNCCCATEDINPLLIILILI